LRQVSYVKAVRNFQYSGTTQLIYNWDGKLRSGRYNSNSLNIKYDPSGNRIYKESTNGSTTTKRKYIVDIVGDLPVILLELDPDNNNSIKKTYIYGNSQIIAQHNGKYDQPKYFYLHDRLGSVRQVINTSGTVKNRYTYKPFGELFEAAGEDETEEYVSSPFKFNGQYYDSEIKEYYLRARQLDPHIYRFTSRDPVQSKFEAPMTLHKYLYCENEPLNRIDPWGLVHEPPMLDNNMYATQQVTDAALDFVRKRGFPRGPIEAFSRQGLEDGEFDYKFENYTFQISDFYIMKGSEYTNWLTAYTTMYLYGTMGNWGTRLGGHYHALTELGHLDEPASRYFISGGILMADEARWREIDERMSHWDFIRAKQDLYAYGTERLAATDLTSSDFDRELDLFLTFWNSTFWNSGSPR